jgi:hypothetical protein
MKMLFAVLASLLLLLGSVPQVGAQSTLATVTLTNSYYQVCVNVSSCQFHFNVVFPNNPGDTPSSHLVTVYANYATPSITIQLWDRVINLEAGEAPTVTVTPDPNNANRTLYHFDFSGADETFTNQYGTQVGPTIEDQAFGTIDFALVTRFCGGGKGGSRPCTQPDSTTTATVNY